MISVSAICRVLLFSLFVLEGVEASAEPSYINITLPISKEWSEALIEYCERRDETIAEALSEFGIPKGSLTKFSIDQKRQLLNGRVSWSAAQILMRLLVAEEKATKKDLLTYLNKAYLDRFAGSFALPESKIVDVRPE